MTMTILKAPSLKPLFGIRHAFFGRTGGWSKGIYDSLNCGLGNDDAPVSVESNRELVANFLEVQPRNLLSCRQIHSPTVVTVTEPWSISDRPEADAIVTKVPNIALGILTADCVPVLFADEKASVIGAAHAGWKGAIGGVLENTVRAMEDLGADRSRMVTALGPCIWQNSYEVGPEFPAPFVAENQDNQKFFVPSAKPGHYMFDLPGYVVAKLNKIGVLSVDPSPADTCADEERFFSYRRNTLRGDKKVASEISTIVLLALKSRQVQDDGPMDDSINGRDSRHAAQTAIEIAGILGF